jgi:prolyl 4-hydroxylase
MSAVPIPPPAPGLAPDWQDWLAGNVVRGVGDAEMLDAMRNAGFDENYARTAISVVRSMTERVQRESPALLVQYRADPIRLPAANRVRAADRDVGIGFVLQDPNVALLTGLLSGKECEELIRLASGKMRRSQVVDRGSGQLEVSAVRTSEGTHFQRGENALVQRLELRIAALTGVPVDHGEPLQVLHYRAGDEYRPHHDYFDPASPGSQEHVRQGGQRVATMVIYLNQVEEGGGTGFPELELSVRPQPGCAVYFEYFNSAGELDSRCLHAGAPVARGEKWVVTKWLRQGPYFR